jgi:hypothetical protein
MKMCEKYFRRLSEMFQNEITCKKTNNLADVS